MSVNPPGAEPQRRRPPTRMSRDSVTRTRARPLSVKAKATWEMVGSPRANTALARAVSARWERRTVVSADPSELVPSSDGKPLS